ncbi:hypothetical protein RA876_17695 [Rhodoferax antarcticus]|nr:hypothetical protein RA876_17695 [Rhodoferax antarcticus]
MQSVAVGLGQYRPQRLSAHSIKTLKEIFMNQTSTTPLPASPDDKDLAKQAHVGHGIPSQDPTAAAQFPLACDDAGRENKSVLMGGGLVAGAATGAAVGVVIAGPVGVLVGGTVGAVVGTLGAAAAGTIMSPADECAIEDAAPMGTSSIDPSPINPSPIDPLPVRPVADSAGDSQSIDR